MTGPRRRLLDLLARFSEHAKPGLGEVFGLVRDFNALLGEAKASIQGEGAAEMKREELLYKHTTEGKWLEGREDYFRALSEAQYLQVRGEVVGTLLQWWGDVLRLRSGAPTLDFPEYSARTEALAVRMSTPEVLRRVTALEELRENFNRTVQEQLAVEVAFLKAFGE